MIDEETKTKQWNLKKYRKSRRTITEGRDLTSEEMDALRDGEVIPVDGRDVLLLMDSYDQIRELRKETKGLRVIM